MRRILVDLNVLLDVLLDRNPHVVESSALWRAVEEERVEGLVAAHGFTTVFYLVAKRFGRGEARRVVGDLLTVFGVAGEDEEVVRRATLLDLDDFEDAVGVAAAEAAGCDAIVTRDLADFAASPLPVFEPGLALALLAGELNEPPPPPYGSPRRRRKRPPSG